MKRLLGKTWLKILLITVIILGGATIWIYNAFSTDDPVVEQQLQEQLGEDFFNIDMDKLFPVSDDKPSENPPDDETPEDPETPADNSPTSPPGDTGSETSLEPKPEPKPPAVTVEYILARHEPKFVALEKLALERLETLFSAGKAEYIEHEENGTLNWFELVNKYIQAGRTLEKGIDAIFYSLLEELRQDLLSHNLSTAIIKTIESDYKKQKDSRRRSFLSLI